MNDFQTLFGREPAVTADAPGRVNLIGEHTDYNDGFVMPAAIQFHTTVAIAPRPARELRVFSENYGEQVELALDKLPGAARRHWSDYVIGIARALEERGVPIGVRVC